jgi:hypothetical protein
MERRLINQSHHSPPKERTTGNGAAAFWFDIQRLSRAVPECER